MTDKNAKNENSKIRIMTFFPPFIILVAFLVLSLVDQETFLGVINNINNWIIKNLGWAASITRTRRPNYTALNLLPAVP